MANQSSFTGYKWRGLLKFPEGTYYHQQGKTFFNSVDWDAVCRYASELHDGEICTLNPQITMGCNHMIRILDFADGSRWIARLRMLSTKTGVEADAECRYFQREVDCIQLVKERIRIPVPALFGYIASANNHIGAPIMFQECLPGNCAMDLNVLKEIPTQHKSTFFAAMSELQVSSCWYLLLLFSSDNRSDRNLHHNVPQNWLHYSAFRWDLSPRAPSRNWWTLRYRNRILRGLGEHCEISLHGHS